jgi:hypothetical protein
MTPRRTTIDASITPPGVTTRRLRTLQSAAVNSVIQFARVKTWGGAAGLVRIALVLPVAFEQVILSRRGRRRSP